MKQSIQVGISLVLIILLLAFINLQPKKKSLNWTPTFSHLDKNPFGSYVLYNELKHWFPKDSVLLLDNETFYNDINPNSDSIMDLHVNRPRNIIIIHPKFSIYTYETQKLIDLVIGGHTVFIASESFPEDFFRMLNADLSTTYNFLRDSISITTNTQPSLIYPKGKIQYTFTDSYQQYNKYSYIKNANDSYNPNMIKLKLGQGTLILHSFPYAFTNYYLLHENPEYKAYVKSIINMLPQQGSYWVDRPSAAHRQTNNKGLLSIIRQIPQLFSAWKLLIIGLLVYILFKAKREQRLIPIIPALKNDSKAYVKVIAQLYNQKNDYLTLVNKKMLFFFDALKTDYHINISQNMNHELIANKTQSTVQDVKQLQELINKCKDQKAFTEDEFKMFCQLTDKILKS